MINDIHAKTDSKSPEIPNAKNLKEKTIFNPFWSVLFLACMAVAIYLFSIPEQIAALLIGFWFVVIVLLNPVNGIYFIILCIPLFLGNSKRPYFLMIEFFLYMTIISAIIHKVWIQKKKWIFPYKYPILFFLGICFISLPINLKELLLELQNWHIMHLLRILGTAHEGFNLYYLRCLLNTISCVIFYIIVVNFISDSERITKIFKPLIVLSVFIAIVGFFLFFNIIPNGNSYLSLSLIGEAGRQFTAFAYNPSYLGQYLILILPIAGFFLLGPTKIRSIIFSLSSLFVFVIALALTRQRAPYIVLSLQIVFFTIIYLYFSNKNRMRIFIIILFLLTTLFLADYCIFAGSGIRSLVKFWEYHPERLHILKTAWQMATQFPLLGVGLGKFHHFFPKYCILAGLPWEVLKYGYIRSTAHNIYMHTLAEQGFLGLGSFLFLLAGIFYSLLKSLRKLTIRQFNIAIILATSLAGWLVFGMVQHMFYIRSIQIFFWIILGCLAIVLRPHLKPMKIPKKMIFGIGIFLLIILCHRIFIIKSYPIKPGYSAGLYDYEQLPDKRRIRWMGKKAVMKLSIQGDTLILNVAAFIPGLEHRPQKLRIRTDQGYKHEVIIKDQDWVRVEIPVNREQRENIWVWLHSSYTIIPKRIGLSNDKRKLGLVLEEIRWETR